eukprot:CAMPEP_0202879392 /NCGR_PEP_ID=MMETSP1391-20130828/33524_1 /ASSEMBLY_ACC=CAM_ASM_000867 /TAXON_ID=1034604 /ORGANISM="Chlamydomonas leiostraca, Strain SAG 11-49" /LENGTH=40 /DNA_ID= /DNA_START= /DNA_END= /DNA_ORIENTATION=
MLTPTSSAAAAPQALVGYRRRKGVVRARAVLAPQVGMGWG